MNFTYIKKRKKGRRHTSKLNEITDLQETKQKFIGEHLKDWVQLASSSSKDVPLLMDLQNTGQIKFSSVMQEPNLRCMTLQVGKSQWIKPIQKEVKQKLCVYKSKTQTTQTKCQLKTYFILLAAIFLQDQYNIKLWLQLIIIINKTPWQ
jgi:hypothetical protein